VKKPFNCPLCKTAISNFDESSDTALCETCDLISYKSMPSEDELKAYYSNYVYNVVKNTEPAVLLSIEITLRGLRNFFPPNHDLALLDFGCGQGDVVLIASQLGFEAYGFEYSEAATKLCRDRGIKMLSIEECESKSFHVVTAYEVVEHMPDPRRFFLLAHKILKKSGILFFTTPNRKAFSARFMNTSSLIYPEHLLGFSKRTGRWLADNGGFNTLSCKTEGIRSDLIISLRNRLFRASLHNRPYSGHQELDGLRQIPIHNEIGHGNFFCRLALIKSAGVIFFNVIRLLVNKILNILSLGETLKVTLVKNGS